jgi:hypothetical protein
MKNYRLHHQLPPVLANQDETIHSPHRRFLPTPEFSQIWEHGKVNVLKTIAPEQSGGPIVAQIIH